MVSINKAAVHRNVLWRNPACIDFENFPGISDTKPGLIGEQDSHRQDSLSVDQGQALRFLASASAPAFN